MPPSPSGNADTAPLPPLPAYLADTYSWAYVTPEAVRRFERQWLVNLILWGNFARLRDAAIDLVAPQETSRTLQIACVYGDLTARLAARHGRPEQLTVIDVLPVQIANLRHKLGADSPVITDLADSTALPYPDGHFDNALLFFLLHEQPRDIRRQTLREACRVVRPGGRIVIVDYHRPHPVHPLFWPMKAILASLEPYALDLWHHDIADWLPPDLPPSAIEKRCTFGGLYQQLTIVR